MTKTIINKKRKTFNNIIRRDWQLYIFALPAVFYVALFSYVPMYGILIAFKNYRIIDGILGSKWVGFNYFIKFFNSYSFWTLIKNTLQLSLMQLIIGFPIPILLALMLNQVKYLKFKKFTQTVTYAPHFISVVVMVGMMNVMLSPSSGIINILLGKLGIEPIFFMGEKHLFKWIYVLSGIWQGAGWGAIIYLAALSGVNTELYESAKIDGANKFHLVRYIDMPTIMPTAVILLILEVGKMMSIGFQKVYLMQNSLNSETSEIISTYVYKIGLVNQQYSYSTAIDLFNSVINIILLITVNKFANKVTEVSLW